MRKKLVLILSIIVIVANVHPTTCSGVWLLLHDRQQSWDCNFEGNELRWPSAANESWVIPTPHIEALFQNPSLYKLFHQAVLKRKFGPFHFFSEDDIASLFREVYADAPGALRAEIDYWLIQYQKTDLTDLDVKTSLKTILANPDSSVVLRILANLLLAFKDPVDNKEARLKRFDYLKTGISFFVENLHDNNLHSIFSLYLFSLIGITNLLLVEAGEIYDINKDLVQNYLADIAEKNICIAGRVPYIKEASIVYVSVLGYQLAMKNQNFSSASFFAKKIIKNSYQAAQTRVDRIKLVTLGMQFRAEVWQYRIKSFFHNARKSVTGFFKNRS